MEYKTLEVKIVSLRREYKTPVYGEMWCWRPTDGGDSNLWLLGCPACGEVATLQTLKGEGHTVTIKDDKPTVSPSIGCPFCQAHYFIKEGSIVVA